MTTTYYKAVRPDGTDFHSGSVQWDVIGSVVRHPTSHTIGYDESTYLSASTVPTECVGMEWPCRLLTVEAVGPVEAPDGGCFPHKRAALEWRVTSELDPHLTLGPQGREVAALIDRASHLTVDEACRLSAAWDAAWGSHWNAARGSHWNAARNAARDTAWDAAWRAAWNAARRSVWNAAWEAASNAAQALVVRDLISDEDFQLLTQPWRDAMGDL